LKFFLSIRLTISLSYCLKQQVREDEEEEEQEQEEVTIYFQIPNI